MTTQKLPYARFALLFISFCLLGWLLAKAVTFAVYLQRYGPMLFGAAWFLGLRTVIILMLAVLVPLVQSVAMVRNLVNRGFRKGFAVRLVLLTAVFGISFGVVFKTLTDNSIY